jgi:ATP-dependent protease Clp ATPase subunit
MVVEPTRCSFCGRTEDQVDKMVPGSDVRICDRCVHAYSEIVANQGVDSLPRLGLRCSFCSKSQRQVSSLLAESDVSICGECLDLCVQFVRQP